MPLIAQTEIPPEKNHGNTLPISHFNFRELLVASTTLRALAMLKYFRVFARAAALIKRQAASGWILNAAHLGTTMSEKLEASHMRAADIDSFKPIYLFI